jgi:tape measure domain-containing protein
VVDKLKRLGDLSLGEAAKLDRLSLSYGKVVAKQKADTEVINSFVEAGVPLLAELAKQFGVTQAAVLKLVEEGKVGFKEVDAAITSMTNNGGQFFNVLEGISQTTEGKLSTAIDNLKLSAAELGEIIIPVVKDILDAVISATDWFTNLDEGTKTAIVAVLGFVAVLGPLYQAIGKVTIAVKALNAGALMGPTGMIALITLAVGALIIFAAKMSYAEEKAREFKKITGEDSKRALQGMKDDLLEITKALQETGQATTKASYGIATVNINAGALQKTAETAADKVYAMAKTLGVAVDPAEDLYVTIEKVNKALDDKLNVSVPTLNSNLAETAKITTEVVSGLSEYEKKILEINAAEEESEGRFESAAAIRLQLIDDEAEATSRAIKKRIAELEKEQKDKGTLDAQQAEEYANLKNDELAVDEYYHNVRRQLSEDTSKKEEDNAARTAAFILESFISVFSTISSVMAAVAQQRLTDLDERKEAELKAAGLIEEKTVESLNKELEAAIAAGDTETADKLKQEITRLKIDEKYNKERSLIQYKAAKEQWALDLASAGVRAALATLNAISTTTPWSLAIAAGILAGAMGTAELAIVAANKPKKPSFATGVFDIPADTMANIHAGETVIPKPFTESIKSGEIAITNTENMPKTSNLVVQIVAQGGQTLKEWIFDGTKNGTIKIAESGLVRI